MKQTKKLTRRQREFLVSKGMKDMLERLRFDRETSSEYIFYDIKENKEIRVSKSGKPVKLCPKCGREYTERSALSRRDNETKICPSCGTMEALEDAGLC